MTKKEQILKEWDKLKTVRQSYGEIAKKVGCYKSYVYKTIKARKTVPGANSKA